MLSVGLSIKLTGFLVITEKLSGCISRSNFSFSSRKKKNETTTCTHPTTYTFGNKKMRRRVEAALYF